MNTTETKLMVASDKAAFSANSLITFHNADREVLRITHDGCIICGENLSADAATQQAAKMLIEAFDEQFKKMLDARVAAMKEASK
jgi:radical SAM superfamily enzyme